MPVRVLLVDDHPVVREGLQAILEAEPDFCVLGTCGAGAAAVCQAAALRPDVVLIQGAERFSIRVPPLDSGG